MSPITIEKSFPVSNVIVTPESARALVKIILSASKELPAQKQYYQQRFTFAATTSDGSQYSSETPELFQNDGELDTKQIENVRISFRDHTNDAHIDVELSQQASRHAFGNTIRVSGTDSTWVSGISEKLRVAVSEFKKQDDWPGAYRPWLVLISAFSFGSIVSRLGNFVFTHIIHIVIKIPVLDIVPGHEWLWRLLHVVWIVLLGSPFASTLMNYLMELWPPVEFRMGRDWMQVLPRRNRRLGWFVTAIVLPLLVSVVYDVLKHYAIL